MESEFTPDLSSSADSIPDQQLKRVIADIKTKKESFLTKYMTVYKDIEDMTRNMLTCAKTSQQNLKTRLQEIGNMKAIEWERQIKLCETAEKSLGNADEASLQTLSEFFAKNIGFIESGEVKFVSWDEPVMKEVEKFGTLSRNDGNLKPKLVITGHRVKELKKPWGVCSDPTGRILVTDCDNNAVHVFNEFGKCLFRFGKSGSGFGEFDAPTGITVDETGRIIISDRNNHRVQVFTFAGRFIRSFGKRGMKPGEFQHPNDVAVNGDAEIAVSDTKKIQLFNTQGVFIAQFSLETDFKVRPIGLAFKPDNSLLFADGTNRCVFFIDKFFKTAVKIGGFVQPQAVACNGDGKFAVSDSGNKTIQVFHDNGNLYKSLNVEEFGFLMGICLLSDGGIIAADNAHNRVFLF